MDKIENFISSNIGLVLILGILLDVIRYSLKTLFPTYTEKLEKYYKLFVCIWVIVIISYCILQKEYILAIFIPIFGIAIIYYVKEIIKELRHKK